MNLTLLTHLTMAVVMDFGNGRISNRLIVSGLIWGLAFRLLGEGSAGAVHFLMNISIPVILLFLLFSLHIMGAGDIKLFSIAGGFLTLTQLCYLIPAAFVVGAVIGAGKIVYKKLTVGYAIGTKTFMNFNWIFYRGLGVGYCINLMWHSVIRMKRMGKDLLHI